MSYDNFSKEDQRKAICFWYETKVKGQKYAISRTWQEFKDKCYKKTRKSMYNLLKNYDKSGTIQNIKQNVPEIFQKNFSNLNSKIAYAKKYGLENVHN